jgi:hypothetical protein
LTKVAAAFANSPRMLSQSYEHIPMHECDQHGDGDRRQGESGGVAPGRTSRACKSAWIALAFLPALCHMTLRPFPSVPPSPLLSPLQVSSWPPADSGPVQCSSKFTRQPVHGRCELSSHSAQAHGTRPKQIHTTHLHQPDHHALEDAHVPAVCKWLSVDSRGEEQECWV